MRPVNRATSVPKEEAETGEDARNEGDNGMCTCDADEKDDTDDWGDTGDRGGDAGDAGDADRGDAGDVVDGEVFDEVALPHEASDQ